MSRDRFAPHGGYNALKRIGLKAISGSGTVKGTKIGGQVLPEDRYAGVIVHIDPEGFWHVSPAYQAPPSVILVVRRVDQRTARITDHDGNPYSELMRIEDAITILRELS